MTLILLAVSLSIALCVIAYNFAIHALPFMVGLTAFQFVYGTGAGLLMSGFATIGAALLSVALVIAVLGFAKNPALRPIALAIFAVPAAIAGYALVYGVTKNAIDSTIALNLLGGIGGLFIGIAAMLNLRPRICRPLALRRRPRFAVSMENATAANAIKHPDSPSETEIAASDQRRLSLLVLPGS